MVYGDAVDRQILTLYYPVLFSSLRETKSACRVVLYQKETNDALPRLIEPGRLGTLLIEWMLSQSKFVLVRKRQASQQTRQQDQHASRAESATEPRP